MRHTLRIGRDLIVTIFTIISFASVLRAQNRSEVTINDTDVAPESLTSSLDGTVYFGSHDKKFYALRPNGTKLWEFATGGQIVSSPALNKNECVYFSSVDGFFYALNLDGKLRWRLQTGGITESSPVIGPEVLPPLPVPALVHSPPRRHRSAPETPAPAKTSEHRAGRRVQPQYRAGQRNVP